MTNDELFKNKIGIIGAGNIGQALILKLLEKNYPYENIQLTYNGSIYTFNSIYDNNLVDMISSNAEIVKTSDILILSVPPQAFKRIGDFNLDDNTLVISFMAGISTRDLIKQTGSNNVVRIIPTGPDTILESQAIAGVFGEDDVAYQIFDLLDIDYITVTDENQMNYIAIAGCLPVVYCRVSPDNPETIEAIDKISEEFPEFKQIAKKCEKLVPEDKSEEFISKFVTPNGVTQAILDGLNSGKTVYDSLLLGLKRDKELSQQ